MEYVSEKVLNTDNNILVIGIIVVIIVCLVYFFMDRDIKQENIDIPMYCIYIPKRKNYIKNFFDKYGLNVNYIKGIDKDTINIDDIIKKKLIKQWSSLNKGRIACHYSHLNVLQNFLDSGKERCIIFEDDIKSDYSKNDLLNILNNLINNIPTDCDILYIGYCFEICNKIQKYDKYFSIGYKPKCRHAYLVNRYSAKKIIDKTSIMYNNGDEMLSDMIKNGILKAYLSNYHIFNQNRDELGSNLGNQDSMPYCI